MAQSRSVLTQKLGYALAVRDRQEGVICFGVENDCKAWEGRIVGGVSCVIVEVEDSVPDGVDDLFGLFIVDFELDDIL